MSHFIRPLQLGANGTKTNGSVSIWHGTGKERIDVENPAPGQRAGQIHYQDQNDVKWYYDPNTNTFFNQKTGRLKAWIFYWK